jgi:carbamoyl-phosphate synthase small subunit
MCRNYGVPGDDVDAHGLSKYFESTRIHARALVVAEYSEQYSHWTAARSLSQWLQSQNVPAIQGIDTRALITKLREGGSCLAKLVVEARRLHLTDSPGNRASERSSAPDEAWRALRAGRRGREVAVV